MMFMELCIKIIQKDSQTVKEDVDLNRIETCNKKTHDIDGQTLEVNSITDVWAHNGN